MGWMLVLFCGGCGKGCEEDDNDDVSEEEG